MWWKTIKSNANFIVGCIGAVGTVIGVLAVSFDVAISSEFLSGLLVGTGGLLCLVTFLLHNHHLREHKKDERFAELQKALTNSHIALETARSEFDIQTSQLHHKLEMCYTKLGEKGLSSPTSQEVKKSLEYFDYTPVNFLETAKTKLLSLIKK